MIITSGTLAPMDQLEREIGVPFPLKLQNGHVIDEDNLMLNILSCSARGGTTFHMDQRSLKDTDAVHRIGQALEYIIMETVGGGVLIFFQAYYKMDEWLRQWHAEGFLTPQSLKGRKVFVDSRGQKKSQPDLEEFREINRQCSST